MARIASLRASAEAFRLRNEWIAFSFATAPGPFALWLCSFDAVVARGWYNWYPPSAPGKLGLGVGAGLALGLGLLLLVGEGVAVDAVEQARLLLLAEDAAVLVVDAQLLLLPKLLVRELLAARGTGGLRVSGPRIRTSSEGVAAHAEQVRPCGPCGGEPLTVGTRSSNASIEVITILVVRQMK